MEVVLTGTIGYFINQSKEALETNPAGPIGILNEIKKQVLEIKAKTKQTTRKEVGSKLDMEDGAKSRAKMRNKKRQR